MKSVTRMPLHQLKPVQLTTNFFPFKSLNEYVHRLKLVNHVRFGILSLRTVRNKFSFNYPSHFSIYLSTHYPKSQNQNSKTNMVESSLNIAHCSSNCGKIKCTFNTGIVQTARRPWTTRYMY